MTTSNNSRNIGLTRDPIDAGRRGPVGSKSEIRRQLRFAFTLAQQKSALRRAPGITSQCELLVQTINH